MKMIVAVIRPEKLDAVITALDEREVHLMTVSDVRGCGRQRGYTETYRGAEYKTRLLPKLKLEIAVNEQYVVPTIEAILDAGRTESNGQIGDGKIFVLSPGRLHSDSHRRAGHGCDWSLTANPKIVRQGRLAAAASNEAPASVVRTKTPPLHMHNHDLSRAEPRLIARRMKWDDIPCVLTIASESDSPWIRPDFRLTLQINETLGFVVEREGSIVGFALCTVRRNQARHVAGRRSPLAWLGWLRRLVDRRFRTERCIRLFAIGTLGSAEAEIERLLLEQIDKNLNHPAGRIEAIVPETNVVAQFILREARFSAERLVRGHFLAIDGYLMARQNMVPRRRRVRSEPTHSLIAANCRAPGADVDG